MEKIYFDESTFIWKGKLKLSDYKKSILEECLDVINSSNNSSKKLDAYGYIHDSKQIDSTGNILINNNWLDKICQSGINQCKLLYEDKFNKVNDDAWINVVRSKNPVQPKFMDSKYHIHTELQSEIGSFFPHYTYVYYIQMPDVMNGDDGVLYFLGKNGKEYWIRPEEDDLIIMEGDMPHAPNNAPNSTIDRIVMAGNVGFEYLKQHKTLI
jgi:hypothetical protein